MDAACLPACLPACAINEGAVPLFRQTCPTFLTFLTKNIPTPFFSFFLF
jgi:hypothetical protein